jgi:drug/metabolite transporter (DMT)-like permease
MTERAASKLVDWTLLIVCNLIWASQFVLAKLVQEQMGPIFATLLPMALATACLVPLVRRQRSQRGTRPPISAADMLRFAVIGVFGQVLAQLGVTWGVRLAPASNAALLSLTLPIATAVIAFMLLGERMTLVRWVSFGLAVAGVLQCSGVEWNDLRFSSGGILAGNLLIMLGVLGSAFYNVYGKKLLHRYTPLEVLLYSYYAVLLCLIPLTLYLEPESLDIVGLFGPKVWLGVLLLAALQYFLSMILFLTVLTRLDAVQAGLSNYLIPVFGVVIAAIILGERLTARMAIGGLVVLGSTLLITVYEEHYVPRMAAAAARRANDDGSLRP